MTTKDLARMLAETADLMEVLGESGFRVNAYRKAARALERYQGELEELRAAGFASLAGIGKGLAAAPRPDGHVGGAAARLQLDAAKGVAAGGQRRAGVDQHVPGEVADRQNVKGLAHDSQTSRS